MDSDQRSPSMGAPIGPQNILEMRAIMSPFMNPPIGRPGRPNPAIKNNA